MSLYLRTVFLSETISKEAYALLKMKFNFENSLEKVSYIGFSNSNLKKAFSLGR